MVRIAVFDSGLGSLSIINAIQKNCKSEIIYFADQKNFPYGGKSKKQLELIIKHTIQKLEDNFSPDLIIMASNTPSLIVKITNKKVIGVFPPIEEAMILSKTKNIAILATKAVIKSENLSNYIKQFNFSNEKKIYKVDSSLLVDLVESNRFIKNTKYCKNIIKKILLNTFKNKIDVATLSSTHLPFLKSLLSSEFPHIKFIDPSDSVVQKILKNIKKNKSTKNKIKIYTSGNIKLFEKNLRGLGIKHKVKFFTI